MVLDDNRAEQPPSVYNRGYAASREQAMRYFKARYGRAIQLTVRREQKSHKRLDRCASGAALVVRERGQNVRFVPIAVIPPFYSITSSAAISRLELPRGSRGSLADIS